MANKKIILEKLQDILKTGSSVTAAAGFDVVIDTVVRLIKKKSQEHSVTYFETIEEFGQHLVSKKNMSCSVEMELQQEKIGGNMAIFSNCLATLGVRTHCIGSMGYPKVDSVFRQMHENCILHSVCKTGQCNALEFQDGKVMLSSMDNLKEMTWENLGKRMNPNELKQYFQESQLIALLNWSEMVGATRLFEEVYDHCIRTAKRDKSKWMLLDISDASRKSPEEILDILKLGRRFAQYRSMIFSMNENEGRLVYEALFGEICEDTGKIGRRISQSLGVDYLILHLSDRAYGYGEGEEKEVPGYYTPTPRLSTGGGDNFNAGLCFGLLHGLALKESLKLGNAVSGYYVRKGHSPDIKELLDFIVEAEASVAQQSKTESAGE